LYQGELKLNICLFASDVGALEQEALEFEDQKMTNESLFSFKYFFS